MTENERLAIVEVQTQQNSTAIQELKSDNKAIHDIAISVQVVATEMKGMSQQMTEMKDDMSEVKKQVNEVETRPAKETAEVVSKVKVAIYTSIATFLAMGIVGALMFFVK